VKKHTDYFNARPDEPHIDIVSEHAAPRRQCHCRQCHLRRSDNGCMIFK